MGLVTRLRLQKLLHQQMQQHLFAHLRPHILELLPLFPTTPDMTTINLTGIGCQCLDQAVRHEGLDLNAEEIGLTKTGDRLDISDT